jgi:hypothetical protein
MAYAAQSLQDGNNDFVHNSGISMSAPVYFNAPGWTAPKPITSHVYGKVLDQDDQPLINIPIEIWNIDAKIASLTTDDIGAFEINAPATMDVRFTLPDGKKEQQWLFYEYPPLLDLIEDTYTIAWAKEYPGLQGGQIPWKAFHFNEIKEVLKEIHWTIKPTGKIMLSGLQK